MFFTKNMMNFFTEALTHEERNEFYDQIGSDCIIFEDKKVCHIHVFLTYLKLGVDISRYAGNKEFITFILPWIDNIRITVTPHRIEWRNKDVVLHYLE